MAAKLLAEVEAPAVWLLADIEIADVNWEGTQVLDRERVRGYIDASTQPWEAVLYGVMHSRLAFNQAQYGEPRGDTAMTKAEAGGE
jgi:hypothetical protein